MNKKKMLERIKAEVRRWRNAPPPDRWLKSMIESDWGWMDYQSWLYRYSYLSQADWLLQRKESRSSSTKPLLSVLTPVYNTPARFLQECVESLLFQSYPYWEMVLVDDGSTLPETVSLLKKLARIDRRIRVFFKEKNEGICKTSNYALMQARGDFAIFLDHDDKFAANALYELSKAIRCSPEVDIVYSDRDMISEKGVRFMHLFKPDWAPETILSSNYLCHMTAYRRSLLTQLQGLDADTEGSQDHDLILRAEETRPHVYHIPKILYHWRQHQESVSLNPQSKDYAYSAAELSITNAISRRKLVGTVEEIPELWRGNYRVRLHPPSESEIYIHVFQGADGCDHTKMLRDALSEAGSRPYIVFLDSRISPEGDGDIQELVSWFQIPEIALSTGKIVDAENKIVHAGLITQLNGHIESIYQGMEDRKTPGYMAWAATAHNVSLPHPGCFAMRKQDAQLVVEQFLKGENLQDVFSIALFLRNKGKRILFTAFARFYVENIEMLHSYQSMDCRIGSHRWRDVLSKGDPYFSKNLTMSHDNDVALNFSQPPFED
jgi:O-antigen biosynthesis protein